MLQDFFVTRKQYDWLIENHKLWMGLYWYNLTKSWSAPGARIYYTPKTRDAVRVTELEHFLKDYKEPVR